MSVFCLWGTAQIGKCSSFAHFQLQQLSHTPSVSAQLQRDEPLLDAPQFFHGQQDLILQLVTSW